MTASGPLLLAGTGAARRLAARLVEAGVRPLASLAGATTTPAAYPCETRVGGFGGAEGLADWIRAHGPLAVVDATHPYAVRISANAAAACAATGAPYLRLDRPPWTRLPGERWIEARDLEGAVAALPPGARAFAATGRSSAEAFAARPDIWVALRVVDPPDAPYPGAGEYVVARPPFDEAAERALLHGLGITHLVVKNAGGAAARTKLEAAASLGLPIVVVARPPEPAGPAFDADEIVARLAAAAR